MGKNDTGISELVIRMYTLVAGSQDLVLVNRWLFWFYSLLLLSGVAI
jgi:hypothetical protein